MRHCKPPPPPAQRTMRLTDWRGLGAGLSPIESKLTMEGTANASSSSRRLGRWAWECAIGTTEKCLCKCSSPPSPSLDDKGPHTRRDSELSGAGLPRCLSSRRYQSWGSETLHGGKGTNAALPHGISASGQFPNPEDGRHTPCHSRLARRAAPSVQPRPPHLLTPTSASNGQERASGIHGGSEQWPRRSGEPGPLTLTV